MFVMLEKLAKQSTKYYIWIDNIQCRKYMEDQQQLKIIHD